ncbi:MAG: hypothetical protein GEV00_07525 [Actinophytocola sp.]|nr:hypothetical protein [Actinophytocola sp.]
MALRRRLRGVVSGRRCGARACLGPIELLIEPLPVEHDPAVRLDVLHGLGRVVEIGLRLFEQNRTLDRGSGADRRSGGDVHDGEPGLLPDAVGCRSEFLGGFLPLLANTLGVLFGYPVRRHLLGVRSFRVDGIGVQPHCLRCRGLPGGCGSCGGRRRARVFDGLAGDGQPRRAGLGPDARHVTVCAP